MSYQILVDQLLFEEEGNTLDFKSEQYAFSGATDEQKAELLKDILAFANAWRRTDAYILIGVKEVKGGRSVPIGIVDHLDDANLQQYINSKTQRPIDFSYKTIQFENVQLGIVHIPVQRRPYYLQRDFGHLKKSAVYVRRGSSTDIASPDEISTMGAERIAAHREAPALDVFLVFGQHDEIVEQKIECNLVNATIPQDDDFPDYGVRSTGGPFGIVLPDLYTNRDYYRLRAKHIQAISRVRGFRLGIKNSGTVPARDVKVVFDLPNEGDTSIACVRRDLPDNPKANSLFIPNLQDTIRNVPDVSVRTTPSGWRIVCHLGKVQPKDVVTTRDRFYLGALVTKSISLKAQIFSDDLPTPGNCSLEVSFEVEARTMSVADLLPQGGA